MSYELNTQKLYNAAAYLDKWLAINVEHSQLVGMQVAVAHKGQIVFSQAYGHANIEQNEALTTNHTFRVASHSKTFTATAIMQLYAAGKLGLDDHVSAYLPWFRSDKDERVAGVTIRQLMNHTAGLIRDGEAADYWQLLQEFPTVEQLKSIIADAELFYDSDVRFKYSNIGYACLGQVVAAVSGIPYDEYVREHIIKVLDLQNTGPDITAALENRMVMGYGMRLGPDERKPLNAATAPTNAWMPATGFYSTAEDLCRYFSAHCYGDERLVSDSGKRVMQHGAWDTQDGNGKYGLGMALLDKRGWTLVGHNGGFPGYLTATYCDPQNGLVVSVLANSYGLLPGAIVRKIVNIIDTFQQDTDNIELPVDRVAKFEGRYYSIWGVSDIVAVGQKLFYVEPLWWSEFDMAHELEVVDATTLKILERSGYGSPGEYVRYEFDADGSVAHIKYAGQVMFTLDGARDHGWL